MAKKGLSWKPRRNGRIYCAPACGHGCTYAAYQRAVKAAQRLADRLGKGWKPHVWENLGWHYSAISKSKHLKVYPSIINKKLYDYTAYFSTESATIGGRWAASGSTPEKALANVMEEALRELNTVARAIEQAEKDMGR